MTVNISTKFITLLGKPLHQSFSARMQNAAYRAMGKNMLYFYTEAEENQLEDIIKGIRNMPFAGFAVTKPNKVEVLKYLDELDPLCEKIGACNTVAVRNGGLIGYNTDSIGFRISLQKETGIDVSQKTFFCAGAGGAGRAICCVLADDRAKKIYLYDKIDSRAQTLAEDINKNFGPVAEFVSFDDKAAMEKAGGADVLINATGVGMAETIDQSPFYEDIIRPEHICYDATYNPTETCFLRQGRGRGCVTVNGIGMLLYQGVAQIKIWTGEDAPVETMARELEDILAGRPEAGI